MEHVAAAWTHVFAVSWNYLHVLPGPTLSFLAMSSIFELPRLALTNDMSLVALAASNEIFLDFRSIGSVSKREKPCNRFIDKYADSDRWPWPHRCQFMPNSCCGTCSAFIRVGLKTDHFGEFAWDSFELKTWAMEKCGRTWQNHVCPCGCKCRTSTLLSFIKADSFFFLFDLAYNIFRFWTWLRLTNKVRWWRRMFCTGHCMLLPTRPVHWEW